jgi:hypothetical protein
MNSGKSLFNNNRIRPVMILVLGLSLAGTARAQSSETINQLFAFTCSGGIIGVDKCPQGGRPNVIIQASDGNFYGAAEVTEENVSNPQGGTLFKLTPAGNVHQALYFHPDRRRVPERRQPRQRLGGG